MSKTGTLKPFSGKRIHENEERAADKGLDQTCCICGNGIRDRKGFWAEVMDGGLRFVAKDEEPDTDDAAYMGCYPIGPACARKLKKQGSKLLKMEVPS